MTALSTIFHVCNDHSFESACLQGQNKTLVFTLHGLAGLVPEPVRYYCTNIRCIVEAEEATTDPMRLLRGLYRSARPEELSQLASRFAGKQLLPESLKAKLVDAIVEDMFLGRELRHRKWCEVSAECVTWQMPELLPPLCADKGFVTGPSTLCIKDAVQFHTVTLQVANNYCILEGFAHMQPAMQICGTSHQLLTKCFVLCRKSKTVRTGEKSSGIEGTLSTCVYIHSVATLTLWW